MCGKDAAGGWRRLCGVAVATWAERTGSPTMRAMCASCDHDGARTEHKCDGTDSTVTPLPAQPSVRLRVHACVHARLAVGRPGCHLER